MARTLHRTQALCPRCTEVLSAEAIDRGGDVYLEMSCPRHGRSSTLYFRDAAFYEALHEAKNPVDCCDTYDCARGQPCAKRASRTMIYMVNVTNNCNMTCDACLSGSEVGLTEPYQSVSRLMDALPDARGLRFMPHVVFFGGEPTMHPELPEMVELAVQRGYVPRLATNGLKLRDERYCRSLVDAGLLWVFLHFDSLDDERNARLRGMPMLRCCLEAIETAQSVGMKVQLGMTVSSENIDELGSVLAFARQHGVFWVSLYPVAEIERHGSFGATFLTDVVEALERQTRGEIAKGDFVAAARLWSRLFRLTGRYNYRQKPTMASLPVIADGKQLVPLTRLVSPTGLLQYSSAALRLARAVPRLLDYEHKPPSRDTLVVNIQQFQGRSAFDLTEAVHTLMSFVHEESFYPFDVYNHIHRWSGDVVRPESLTRPRA
jgi:uncharacterized radical SAM superfamily Fe-S cluster-containing enzyme